MGEGNMSVKLKLDVQEGIGKALLKQTGPEAHPTPDLGSDPVSTDTGRSRQPPEFTGSVLSSD